MPASNRRFVFRDDAGMRSPWMMIGLGLTALGIGFAALAFVQETNGGTAGPTALLILRLTIGAAAAAFLGTGIIGLTRRLRAGSDASFAAVDPRQGKPPRPGMWTFEDVAAELALAARELEAPFEVRSNGRRIRITREHAGGSVGGELLKLGYGGLIYRDVGPITAPRNDLHVFLERVLRPTIWGIAPQ